MTVRGFDFTSEELMVLVRRAEEQANRTPNATMPKLRRRLLDLADCAEDVRREL